MVIPVDDFPNGQLNGFASSDEEEGESSDGEEEKEEGSLENGGEDEKDEESDDFQDGDDDDEDDSDSAPEDVSFETAKAKYTQSAKLQQDQIEKSKNELKEKRRKRDELLKEQKAAKLKRLKDSALPAEFLLSLKKSQPPEPEPASIDSVKDIAPSDPSEEESTAPSKKAKSSLIPLPDVDGIEFEVVVQRSNADEEIMRRAERYINHHIKHRSIPRMTNKRKLSMAKKKKFR